MGSSHEVPVPVHQHMAGINAQAREGSPGGETLRLRHPKLVTLLRSGMAHGPGFAPGGQTLEESLALGLTEHLRIPNLVDAAIPGNYRSPHAEGARPSATSHFVYADHHRLRAVPQRPLQRQPRGTAAKAGTEAGNNGGGHARDAE